ncbi:MAG TPA: IPT/TIG domain-containing protein [Parafilimonas sp.]|nr:IPT/TIG domain-containing protein [Parafilimonas sp.]
MENEISGFEKKLAGTFLILFTCAPAIFILWFWPDRLPEPKEFIKPLYYCTPFHVRLAGICDTISFEAAAKFSVPDVPGQHPAADANASATSQNLADSPDVDSENLKKNAPAIPLQNSGSGTNTAEKKDCHCDDTTGTKYVAQGKCIVVKDESKYLHLNTILLIIVALAGFLGNMIHVATSFTTYIGSKKFVRSWLLWYCVRPFTGAALATVVYFVFRGGFLNMNDGSASVNLYGIVAMSLLAGMFTDRATKKLKEVFDVMFKTNEENANPLDARTKITSIIPPTDESFRGGELDARAKITSITPLEIEQNKENVIKISGENLKVVKLSAFINDEEKLISDITDTSASIKYTIPATQADKTSFVLVIKDNAANVVTGGTATLALKPAEEQAQAPVANSSGVNEETGDDEDETNDNNNVKE